MPMKRCAVIFSILLVVAVSGCDRQTSVTDSRATSGVNRLPKVGDTAEYSIVYFLGTSDVNTEPLANGRRTCRITTSANRGRELPSHIVRSFDVREDIETKGGLSKATNTVTVWLGEDKLGNLYLLGACLDGSTWDVVTDANPPLYMPHRIQEGASWSYVAHFASGATESLAFEYVGRETMMIAEGQHEAYKLKTYMSHSLLQITASGYTWLPVDPPFLFELKSELESKSSVLGMPVTTRMLSTLERIRLSK